MRPRLFIVVFRIVIIVTIFIVVIVLVIIIVVSTVTTIATITVTMRVMRRSWCSVEMLKKDAVGFAYTLELSCGFFISRIFVGVCFECKLGHRLVSIHHRDLAVALFHTCL